jgi:hypothetical protein
MVPLGRAWFAAMAVHGQKHDFVAAGEIRMSCGRRGQREDEGVHFAGDSLSTPS